ncbi:MAG TPA: M48 family metallopeptidase [Lacunisphaera sp.]|nr:M48 family metallopeptidase [Lacunisphaera sp.]
MQTSLPRPVSHPFVLVAVLLVTVLAGGCYQVPVTGRHATNMVSDKSVKELSQKAFEQLKKTHKISRNQAMIDRVTRVGERLAKVVFWDVPDAEWEFVVFDAPNEINAFAMAGGKVGVFTGLFKIIQNDDQLASVLAHEIGHVSAKHVNERLSQQMLIDGGELLVGGIMSTTGAGSITGNAVLQAYGLTSGVGAVSFDRAKEKEADHIGIMYMARAGYNPEEAVRVIENLENATAGLAGPPAILSTHPSNPERILQLMDLMPRALEAYEKSRQKTPAK